MPAAIFDVDRTLLDGMSGYFFSAWLWKTRRMPHRGRLRTARSLILYRLKLAPETEMVEVGATALAHLRVDEVARLAEQCVEEIIGPRVFSEAVKKIAEHNAAGDFTLLASGSAQPVIEALAKKVGAKGAVGTRPRLGKNGAYLPEVVLPLCYRDGKTELVERMLATHGFRLEDAFIYSDNAPDIPLMERTAHPFAVNPDAALRAHAELRGWPILTWNTLLPGNPNATGTRWPLR